MRYIFAIVPLFINNCGPGWSIAGYEFAPSDSTQSGVIELFDSDSIKHIYKELNFDGFDYCLIHWQYEEVKKVN